jgi:hypothetical protein
VHGSGRRAWHASHTDDLGTGPPAHPPSNGQGHRRTTKDGR